MMSTKIMEIISSLCYLSSSIAVLCLLFIFVTFLDILLFGCSFHKVQPQNTRIPFPNRERHSMCFYSQVTIPGSCFPCSVWNWRCFAYLVGCGLCLQPMSLQSGDPVSLLFSTEALEEM